MAATSVGGGNLSNGVIQYTLSAASINRSNEFLSCAKTAVKIAKSQYLKRRKLERQQQRGLHDDSDIDENDLLSCNDLEDPSLWFMRIDPNSLSLYNPNSDAQSDVVQGRSTNSMKSIFRQGCLFLEDMETKLLELDGLVRRRGQSNDPANEITVLVSQLELIASSLSVLIQSQMVPIRIYGQRAEHYKQIQVWFQMRTQQYYQRLKEILAIRATVVAEQTKRRRRFVAQSALPAPSAAAKVSTVSSGNLPGTANPVTTIATVQSYYQSDNPLFTAGPVVSVRRPSSSVESKTFSSEDDGSKSLQSSVNKNVDPASSSLRNISNDISRGQTSAPSTYSSTSQNGFSAKTTAGYGGASIRHQKNYYDSKNGSQYPLQSSESDPTQATMGIRRRGTAVSDSRNIDTSNQTFKTSQSQQREQLLMERQTQSRLREAKIAEKSLAELGTVFGKMSTLIMQQSETITKIEDDVEAAQGDVSDGQNEITILYQLKKGNRMLIIKTYSLLIFLIIFMRLYASPKR